MVVPKLSRRERQIMDVVYAVGRASVNDVVAAIDDPPSAMSVRRTMHILVEKGFLKTKRKKQNVTYLPAKAKSRAGSDALSHVVDTFFDGSLTEALAVYFNRPKQAMSPAQRKKLLGMIESWEEENDS